MDEELAVIAFPRPSPKVVNFHDSIADLVEEIAVVGNDELGAFEFGQKGLKPFGGMDVQVIGRFVKKHDIDAVEADELASQRQFGLFTA